MRADRTDPHPSTLTAAHPSRPLHPVPRCQASLQPPPAFPQIGPVSEALLQPDPLDLALDCSWAGGRAAAWQQQQEEEEEQEQEEQQQQRHKHTQQHTQAANQSSGATGAGVGVRPWQGGAAAAAAPPAAAAVSAPPGSRRVSLPPPRPMRLAVVGLEVPADLLERIRNSGWGAGVVVQWWWRGRWECER